MNPFMAPIDPVESGELQIQLQAVLTWGTCDEQRAERIVHTFGLAAAHEIIQVIAATGVSLEELATALWEPDQ